MVRFQALERRRIPEPLVADHEFVQQRRPRAPMAEDEDRRLGQLDLANDAAVYRVLKEPEQRVGEAEKGNDDGNIPWGRMNRAAIWEEQFKPGEEIAPLPHARRPPGFLGGNGRRGGGWRHPGAAVHRPTLSHTARGPSARVSAVWCDSNAA